MLRSGPCSACGGAGKVPEQPCEECGGRGRTVRERTWDVEVPPGIESGQRIRISGAGHVGETGGVSGDLYVQVLVADDERFHREGQDLVTVVDLPATDAMLGTTVEVSTLEGEREVEVEPGAQHGDRVRLAGLGLPSLRGAARGDLHVLFSIVVPSNLSDEQRELAQRLSDMLGERNFQPERSGILSRLRRVVG